MILFLFTSCEEVVEVDLEETEPRLVVEASIEWIKGSYGNRQDIRLSTTVPYYDDDPSPVEDAEVKIIAENGSEVLFEHESGGYYTTEDFAPELNNSYQLRIQYRDELFTATSQMMPVADLDSVVQTRNGGFNGDEIELKAFYTDPANVDNYYLFIFTNEKSTLEIYEDEFTDGNAIFGYYSNEDIEPGDMVRIEMSGISKSYYEYLFILRSQIGNNGGGPFETQPATVRGNIVNRTNPENYPFGYFHLSQVDTLIYNVR